MKFSIVSEYPFWFFIFCILLGVLYSFILYYSDKSKTFSPVLTKFLFALRTIVIAVTSFLLISPLIKKSVKIEEKPVIVIAVDNSESIKTNKDSVFYKEVFPLKIDELKNKLSEKYDVRMYSFGNTTKNYNKIDFSEKQTDISSLFTEISSVLYNRNGGALILASDGLYNKGYNPVYASEKLNIPIYTVALGDTSIQKDILIKKTIYNKITYLGNNFPIEIVVNSNKYKGSRNKLSVTKDNEVIYNQEFEINDDVFQKTFSFKTEAKKTGLQHFKISLLQLKDEISYKNNYTDIFIDVLDSRQKILLLYSAPHPDISALKEAIEINKNYEVESSNINNFRKNINLYNLIILHQIPSIKNQNNTILPDIINSKVSKLFITGSQTNYNAFNKANQGLEINISKQATNECQPVLNNTFGLFTLSEETRNKINDFPPLFCAFGNYKLSPGSSVMFYQKIGSVQTGFPLITFSEINSSKNGFIACEGIWKWKYYDYSKNNNHNIFNEIILKTLQYLSVRENKSNFRIKGKTDFYENEQIEFDAELYNKSYELVNEPDIKFTITDSENKSYQMVFSKVYNAYHLNAGIFPVGKYNYEADVNFANQLYNSKGQFSILPVNIEASNTIADFQLLYSLAKKHDGEIIDKNNLQHILKILENKDNIKPLIYYKKSLTDLIDYYVVFFLILLLIATEWFIRKRSGAY